MTRRQAFPENPELQQFVLPEARPTGKQLGIGSYGSVEELKVKGLVCAGKRMHESLLERDNAGVSNIERKYLEECQVMAKMRHPHVVQFLGLCYLEGSTLPMLVMERMDSSLDELLESAPGLPLALKRSILTDVVRGLLYLHTREPPIVHRDLTSKNILLTSSLLAKISDLGNARIVPGQLARSLTCMPGTAVYMPPEASQEASQYGPPLDIFSYGHLALFTLTQVFPGSLLPSTFADSENPNRLLARSELQRRCDYIQPLHRQLGEQHPLVQLVHQCLHNSPTQRPSAEELLQQLDETRAHVELPYGSYHFKVQSAMMSVIETKMGEKDREIEHLQQELRQLQEYRQRLQVEVDAKDTQLQQKNVQLQQKNAQLQQKDSEIEQQGTELLERTTEINRQQRDLQTLREDKRRLQQQAHEMDAEVSRKQREIQTLRDESVAKDTRLTAMQSQLQKLQRDKVELRQKCDARQKEVEKLERYRRERDGAKGQMEELQWQLQTANEELQRVSETCESNIEQLQDKLSQHDQEVSALKAKAKDHESRMRRYREERNQAQLANKTFQDKISMLSQTVESLKDELQSKKEYLNRMENSMLDSTDYPSFTHEQPDQCTSSDDDLFNEDMESPTALRY